MNPEELRQRFALFARDVRLFAKPFVRDPEARDIATQLMRSATSVASNHRAAGRGRSHAEFTAKIGVAPEEADEAEFCLQHLRDCGFVSAKTVGPLLQEAGEIVAMLSASCSTARSNRNRRPRRHPRDGPIHE
jgi:four helix bundle protein